MLTFKDAGKNFMRHIPNHHFDMTVRNDLNLEILKPTELQRIQKTDVFNGNRYMVVTPPPDITTIPDSLPIRDTQSNTIFQVRIGFLGKKWFCGRCMKEHLKACPELEDFYKQFLF